MITVSHSEGPDPNGVDPLAADEPQVCFHNQSTTGDRMPCRSSPDRSREGAVGSEETILLDSNLPSVPRSRSLDQRAPYWAEAPSEAKGRVVEPGPNAAAPVDPAVVCPNRPFLGRERWA